MANGEPNIRLLGLSRSPLRDAFHWFLRARWVVALGVIVVGYLALNGVFATAYFVFGGVAHMREHSWLDAYFFSIHTMGTIGYGSMYPESLLANLLVAGESVTGLLVTAVATGLTFAKFGRTTGRVAFSAAAVITQHDGVPTLMVRLGNDRVGRIVDAKFMVTLVRTERSVEGTVFYRMYDLNLARAQTAALSRTYTLLHVITPESPLYGYTPARLERDECELHVTVSGVDDTTLQPVHAIHIYADTSVRMGHRLVDVITVHPNGDLTVDLDRFHETVPDGLAGVAT